MKKAIILLYVLGCMASTLFAQNFLSPMWKISFSNISTEVHDKLNIDSWGNVNLLLSWERQGYYSGSGKCCLAQKFVVPESYKDTDFSLSFSLQCDVESVYVIGKKRIVQNTKTNRTKIITISHSI